MLCERLGIDDYEQWLEDCPERVFSSWKAAHAVRPFGGEQHLLARIAALLFMQVQSRAGHKTWETMDRIAALFMPADWIGRNEGAEIEIDLESIKASQKALEQGRGNLD